MPDVALIEHHIAFAQRNLLQAEWALLEAAKALSLMRPGLGSSAAGKAIDEIHRIVIESRAQCLRSIVVLPDPVIMPAVREAIASRGAPEQRTVD